MMFMKGFSAAAPPACSARRHEPLADAALAQDQEGGRLAPGDAADEPQDLLHGRALRDDRGPVHLGQLGQLALAPVRHLLAQPPGLEGARDDLDHLVHLEGLREIVVGALLGGLDGALEARVGRDHHDRHPRGRARAARAGPRHRSGRAACSRAGPGRASPWRPTPGSPPRPPPGPTEYPASSRASPRVHRTIFSSSTTRMRAVMESSGGGGVIVGNISQLMGEIPRARTGRAVSWTPKRVSTPRGKDPARAGIGGGVGPSSPGRPAAAA